MKTFDADSQAFGNRVNGRIVLIKIEPKYPLAMPYSAVASLYCSSMLAHPADTPDRPVVDFLADLFNWTVDCLCLHLPTGGLEDDHKVKRTNLSPMHVCTACLLSKTPPPKDRKDVGTTTARRDFRHDSRH
ncbi:unnamed protein product [Protopolystoma xenopodis]|uniref:Uncharacterized protein n=1 Tax=Protopolystoma xenopodis TaxID=117903 RepID=A0A448WUK6_9PLAT|nr:unnamed protein product [Protopolystoma xenopodis]